MRQRPARALFNCDTRCALSHYAARSSLHHARICVLQETRHGPLIRVRRAPRRGPGVASSPAAALTATECSAKYQAAKQAGTLNGQKWNDFRKAECGANAAPAAAPAASTVPNPMAPGGNKVASPAPAPAPSAAAPKPAPAAAGTAGFPAKVDPKYASEPAGKQRMHTCLDSYNTPPRPLVRSAISSGSRRAAAITASATSG